MFIAELREVHVSGAPHLTKFGNHVIVRLSICTTGKQLLFLASVGTWSLCLIS